MKNLLKYHDSPLYFMTAREAAIIEREGDFERAAKVWAKAHRQSRNALNQDWSAKRQDFCLMHQIRLARQVCVADDVGQ